MTRSYSNKTLAKLAYFMEKHFTHPELDALFLYASIPATATSGTSKLSRSLNAIKFLSRTEELSGEIEHSDLLDLLLDEIIIRKQHVFDPSLYFGSSANEEANSLRYALNADGYDVVNGKIVSFDELEFELVSETSILEQKLQTHGMFDVIKLLDQAHQNFIESNYEASNAVLRASLESTLKHIALKIAGTETAIPASNARYGVTPADVRRYLENEKFFQQDEINFIKAFYGYASTNGSHPGMSNQAESRLRRLMIVALIQYSLEKLEF
jgi:hypothetical protein